jgi:hypothetical protein
MCSNKDAKSLACRAAEAAADRDVADRLSSDEAAGNNNPPNRL